MKLEDFKRVNGLESIPLGFNENSGRYITDVVNKNNEKMRIISVKGIDLEKDIYVYETITDDVNQETGEKTGNMVTLHVLSNKKGLVPVATI